MFRSRWRVYHHLVTVVALTVLTGCGAASSPSVAVGSASNPGTTAGPTSVSATTASATVGLTGTTASPSTAPTTALIAGTGTGSVTPALISTTGRSSAATTTAPVSARTATTAASSGGNVTQALTFSGDLSGSFTTTRTPDLCGKKDQDFGGTTIHHTFGAGLIQGTINGATYGLGFTVDTYHGPDTYKDAAIVSLANLATQEVFLNLVNNLTTVVVAPGETSGTIESDVATEAPSKPATVHISGTWRCR
jgi:hypothetical protein